MFIEKIFWEIVDSDTKYQIEENLRDTSTAIRVAKATITRTSNNYREAVTKLYDQRKIIYETTLTRFAATSEKIVLKEREFNQEKFLELYKTKIDPVRMEVNLSLMEKNSGGLLELMVPGGSTIKHFQLKRRLKESESDLYEAEAEKEEIKIQCAKVRAITKELKTFYLVIDTLQKLTDKLIDQVNLIIDEKGSDPSAYTEEDWDTLMHMFNFGKALNDITKTDVFNKNGGINSWFSRYMKAGRELLPSKKSNRKNK